MTFRELFKASKLFRASLYVGLVTIMLFIIALLGINATVQKIRQKQAFLDSRQNIQLNFEQILAFYAEEYGGLRTSLDTIIPTTDDLVNILEIIEAKANLLGLQIETNNLAVDTKKTPVPFVRYRLTFEGNTSQLLSLLATLNSLPVYVEIQSIRSVAIEEFTFSQLSKHEIIYDIFIRN